MGLRNFFAIEPIKDTESTALDAALPEARKLGATLKTKSLALGFTGLSRMLGGRARTGEGSPYDFDRIIEAVDSDSYAKVAFAKYRELMWKDGYEIVGENQEAVDYLLTRIEYMSIAMGVPFSEFLETAGDSLCKFHNVFIAKIRNPALAEMAPNSIKSTHPKGPVVGYEIIPTEKVRIVRDNHNRPIRYVQAGGYSGKEKNLPTWDASEVIHLSRDKKPGYPFGTPFMTASIDDIVGLRQMELDIQNMVHQSINPVIDVTVGSDEVPAEDEEIDETANQIGAMQQDGVIIHSERSKIAIHGLEGKALDASSYLGAFAARVAIGLGLYPHHLGLTFGGANRSMTEQLDIALYDRVKSYQRYISLIVIQFMFNEILIEGGFNPFKPISRTGISDKCVLEFSEIDQDTKIKKENHIIQQVTTNLMTIPEGRFLLGRRPEFDEMETLAGLSARMSAYAMQQQAQGPIDEDGQEPSSGGAPNQKNYNRGAANRSRPKNQHGRSLSPNVKHSDNMDTWNEVADALLSAEEISNDSK